ncbi:MULTISPECIES: hypothetical protein [Bacillaceae]|nr:MULTISPECIES: hypothetical protein [Bacillaceae]MBN8202753.1 hypothetical protein [Bacillus sp. NTK034]MCM3244676.1 hypothetical protein [Cytobacillus oceanisediminis]
MTVLYENVVKKLTGFVLCLLFLHEALKTIGIDITPTFKIINGSFID